MSLPDHPLDFTGRRVLVVGGSSGIGNGIARAFLERGASVAVWGTRASAADYAVESGSDLAGLDYASVDVADAATASGAHGGAYTCAPTTPRYPVPSARRAASAISDAEPVRGSEVQ